MATISLQDALWKLDLGNLQKLNPSQILIYIYAAHRLNPEGTARISVEILNERLKIPVKTVEKSIQKLLQLGFFEDVGEWSGKSNEVIRIKINDVAIMELENSMAEKRKKVMEAAESLILQYPLKTNTDKNEVFDELWRILNPKLANHKKVNFKQLKDYAMRHHREKGQYAFGLIRFLKENHWEEYHGKP